MTFWGTRALASNQSLLVPWQRWGLLIRQVIKLCHLLHHLPIIMSYPKNMDWEWFVCAVYTWSRNNCGFAMCGRSRGHLYSHPSFHLLSLRKTDQQLGGNKLWLTECGRISGGKGLVQARANTARMAQSASLDGISWQLISPLSSMITLSSVEKMQVRIIKNMIIGLPCMITTRIIATRMIRTIILQSYKVLSDATAGSNCPVIVSGKFRFKFDGTRCVKDADTAIPETNQCQWCQIVHIILRSESILVLKEVLYGIAKSHLCWKQLIYAYIESW